MERNKIQWISMLKSTLPVYVFPFLVCVDGYMCEREGHCDRAVLLTSYIPRTEIMLLLQFVLVIANNKMSKILQS